MIIHPDGSIEGTPEELHKYMEKKSPQWDFRRSPQWDFRRVGIQNPIPFRHWEKCSCNPVNGGSGVCGCTIANKFVAE